MLDAWRPVYLGFCVLMIGVVILDALFIRDPPKTGEAEAGQSLGVFESLRGVASTGALVPLFVGYFVSGFSWCFWSWLPKFLVDAKGFNYVEAGFLSSIPTVTSIIGCILVGAVSDRRRRLLLAVFSALDALLLAVIVSLPISAPLPVFIVSVALSGITSAMWVLPYAMVAESLPPNLSGVGLGLLNFLDYLGSIAMTSRFGALVDRTGSYLPPNTLVISISVVVVFLYSILVKETYPQS